MRLLANENVPGQIIEALRARGHDVVWVRTDAPGSSDKRVLRRAASEQRLLLTFDKDFGELAFDAGLPAACGVVLLRLACRSLEDLTRIVVGALESRDDWAGHFSVVEHGRVRVTRLPAAPRPDYEAR